MPSDRAESVAHIEAAFQIANERMSRWEERHGNRAEELYMPGGMQTRFFDDRPEQYRPGADAVLAPPAEVAAAALFALTRPPGVDVREMMVSVSTEPSWP
jgi:hypothetical protein